MANETDDLGLVWQTPLIPPPPSVSYAEAVATAPIPVVPQLSAPQLPSDFGQDNDPVMGEQQFVPNKLLLTHRTRFYKNPATGTLSVQYTTDGGITWQDFVSQPSSIATEGWVPTIGPSNTVVWRPITALLSGSGTTGSGSSDQAKPTWTDFSFPGALSNSREFGFFKVPSGMSLRCYGIQMTVFSPATGADIVLDLVSITENGVSVPQNKSIVLTANSLFGTSFFDGNGIPMPANTTWRLKVIQSGTQDPGEFLSCRLMFAV